MHGRKRRKKRLFFSVTAFLLILVLILTVFLKMRPVVISYAQNTAKRMMLTSANESVAALVSENDIAYDDIVHLNKDASGYVTSLQVDVFTVNLLKSQISLEISKRIAQKEGYTVSIPIGTFLGNEYTNGLGPKVHFTMQLVTNTVADFSFQFEQAGLNQVIHRVILELEINGRLIMKGATDSFSVKTSVPVAETVIVGMTPDAFTQVFESGFSDTAGLINDYGAVVIE